MHGKEFVSPPTCASWWVKSMLIQQNSLSSVSWKLVARADGEQPWGLPRQKRAAPRTMSHSPR